MIQRTHIATMIAVLLAALLVATAGCSLGPGEPRESEGLASGRELYDAGRFEEAITVLEEAVQTDPEDAEARKTLALALAATGDLDGAIEQYREVINVEPEDHETLYRLGLLERQAGDAQEAAAHLLEAAELNPQDASYWDEAAKTLLQLGRAEEAADAWGKVLEIDDITDETRKAILVSQGEAYVAARMMGEAAASYEAAIEVDPSDQNLRTRLAEINGEAPDG